MAQAIITHFDGLPEGGHGLWRAATEWAVASQLYDREPEPGDVTVITPMIDLRGSTSDARTEIWIQRAGGDWERNATGERLDPDEASVRNEKHAFAIGRLVLADMRSIRSLNVWVTPYNSSGWANFPAPNILEP